MYKLLPEKLIYLAGNCPYPLYVVGGRVRDFLSGLKSERADNDICAPADAEDFSARAAAVGFSVDAIYKNTGTVKLSYAGEDLEFTCFRSDEYVRGEHRPAKTFLTSDINLDARRRDFKCNAVYYDIAARKIVDPLGGIEDIRNKRITTVAPAEKVFGEDGLRLMRLARIAAQTGFTPTDACLSGATANCALIRDVSVERIYAELNAILHAEKKYGVKNAPYAGLKILQKIGVLKEILPELTAGEGILQRQDFHKYDVLEHSLRAVYYSDESVRLAALLHDIGKPYCYNQNGNFHGHEKEGARIAEEVCTRLKVSKKVTEETVKLIALHMYDLRGDARENKVRKFIIENLDVLDKLLLLKQADFSACKDDLSAAPSVEKINRILGKMRAEGVPFTIKQLDLRGDELIKCGFSANMIGKTLESLLSDCAIGQVKNQKELLISYAQKVYLPKKKEK